MTVDLDTLAELAKAATPGPWHIRAPGMGFTEVWDSERYLPTLIARSSRYEDAAYILTCSPDVVLELVERVREAEAQAIAAGEAANLQRDMWGDEFCKNHDLRERLKAAEARVRELEAREVEHSLGTYGREKGWEYVAAKRGRAAYEARARAEKAEAERDALREELERLREYNLTLQLIDASERGEGEA